MEKDSKNIKPQAGDLVFVYGTLKAGFYNHRVMQYAKGSFVSRATTTKAFPMIDGGFPYLYDEEGVGNEIVGEVYQIPTEQGFSPLDGLEGYPHHYTRRKVGVVLSDEGDKTVDAWVYFANHERQTDELISEFR